MNKIFLFKLALKNLWSRKLRTIMTILGVSIGVGFVSFLVFLGLGLQRVSTSEITNLEALQVLDVTVGNSRLIELSDEEIPKFESLGNVSLVAPHFQVASKIELGHSSVDGITYGKVPKALSLEEVKILAGKGELEKDSLLVTSSALKQLGFRNFQDSLGKDVKLTLVPKSDSLDESKREGKKEFSFKVTGVLENDTSSFAYLNIENLKEAGFRKYDGLKVKLSSKNDVSSAKKKIESMGYKVTSLKDTVDQINQFFSIFQMILISFGIIAVIVACLGMFNTLTINLLEKTREVGFMRVLGTKKKDISRLFLTESLIIGVSGGLIGVFFAYFVGSSLNLAIAALAKSTGNKPVELFYMPLGFMLVVLILVSLISFLTGLWPSTRASKINPLDALRYE